MDVTPECGDCYMVNGRWSDGGLLFCINMAKAKAAGWALGFGLRLGLA